MDRCRGSGFRIRRGSWGRVMGMGGNELLVYALGASRAGDGGSIRSVMPHTKNLYQYQVLIYLASVATILTVTER